MMSKLLFELPLDSAERFGDRPCLTLKGRTVDYAFVATQIERFASALIRLGSSKLARVAVYLPKQPETVITMFGAARAGCAFVPVNPILKPAQVGHILRDCNVSVLVTSPERLRELAPQLAECPDLRHVILDNATTDSSPRSFAVHGWDSVQGDATARGHRVIDQDMVSIFYTSGSTGKPKGVVLSHRNMVTGAHSVAEYLGNTPQDRLLAVLPFSFDYGFSQLSTAFHVGASVVLMDYLFARDVIALAGRERVTGLAGVPPLWVQLADLPWSEEVARLAALHHQLRRQDAASHAREAARIAAEDATVPDVWIDGSVSLDVSAARRAGAPTGVDGQGDPQCRDHGRAVRRHALRCRRAGRAGPSRLAGLTRLLERSGEDRRTLQAGARADPALVLTEMAVWSGDTVRRDAEGFLYFVGRRDEMIKTCGYRVSPTEVEEVVFGSGLVSDAAAVGVTHPTLGQAIVIVATAAEGSSADSAKLLDYCRKNLPTFMVPAHIEWRDHAAAQSERQIRSTPAGR